MKGKDKCEFLRSIRKDIAEKYDLNYSPKECHHEGDCAGTCPVCDAELTDLQHQLNEKGIQQISPGTFEPSKTDKSEKLLLDDDYRMCVEIPDETEIEGVEAEEGDVIFSGDCEGSILEDDGQPLTMDALDVWVIDAAEAKDKEKRDDTLI